MFLDFCFTDSVWHLLTHPRESPWGKIQVIYCFSKFYTFWIESWGHAVKDKDIISIYWLNCYCIDSLHVRYVFFFSQYYCMTICCADHKTNLMHGRLHVYNMWYLFSSSISSVHLSFTVVLLRLTGERA